VSEDSGALKKSISYTFGNYTPANGNVRGFSKGGVQGDEDLTVTVHAGNQEAWYAGLVEFGTKNDRFVKNYLGQTGVRVNVGSMPAQPFFFPAYRANKKNLKSNVTRAMRKAIKQAAGK
jgi:HK97 gp10 family phage protein